MVHHFPGIWHEPSDETQVVSSPKSASTVLLVRNHSHRDEVEVLLIERALSTNFGGAFVFPGGTVAVEDYAPSFNEMSNGPNDRGASTILSIENGGLAYWVACIRECFEEAGILLAHKNCSGISPIGEVGDIQRFANYRNKLNQREPIFEYMCVEESLVLDTNRLVYLSHWITPKTERKRYTTRFFVAAIPDDQEAVHDGAEAVHSLWIRPEEALRQQKKGKLPMIMPTIANLRQICGFSSTDKLLQEKFAIDPNSISAIEPKLFKREGKWVGLLPGEPGYDEH
jgi:8-oxo-dGTP pyrophosphatase MutT (NUDIX family)